MIVVVVFIFKCVNIDDIAKKSNKKNLFHFLVLEGGLLILIDCCHSYSVTIPRRYKVVYVNSFFSCTAWLLWNSLPIECFPLTDDLNGFNWPFNCMFFLTQCLIVAVQPWMKLIPILKKLKSNKIIKCHVVKFMYSDYM